MKLRSHPFVCYLVRKQEMGDSMPQPKIIFHSDESNPGNFLREKPWKLLYGVLVAYSNTKPKSAGTSLSPLETARAAHEILVNLLGQQSFNAHLTQELRNLGQDLFGYTSGAAAPQEWTDIVSACESGHFDLQHWTSFVNHYEAYQKNEQTKQAALAEAAASVPLASSETAELSMTTGGLKRSWTTIFSKLNKSIQQKLTHADAPTRYATGESAAHSAHAADIMAALDPVIALWHQQQRYNLEDTTISSPAV